jgi:hypothetical protein
MTTKSGPGLRRDDSAGYGAVIGLVVAAKAASQCLGFEGGTGTNVVGFPLSRERRA